MQKYDYLVVGCGLFGIVFSQQATERGKKVLVLEKRRHIGGNCYTENVNGILVHRYGPHIFHTDEEEVWRYVNNFARFNGFVNRPKVFYRNKIYSFPINLMTLYQLWGVKTPQEAREKIKEVALPSADPQNLEEWALSQVGKEIYEIFIRGYTKKQWGMEPRQLPPSIIKRLPIRLSFDDNYYAHRYQGIPIGGYTGMFETMLTGVEVRLNTDYFKNKSHWDSVADRIVYTGRIDELFDYKLGRLGYRSLRFETEEFDGDFQGNAVINYTDELVPHTRIIEHKHFESGTHPQTVVTWEYPCEYNEDLIPYYPVNTGRNNNMYAGYKALAGEIDNLIIGGRLAAYAYMDMDAVVFSALRTVQRVLA